MAVTNPEMRVGVLQQKVLLGKDYEQYLVVPRVSLKLSTAEKRAIMDYCREHRKPLCEIVSESFTSLADEITENDTESDANG